MLWLSSTDFETTTLRVEGEIIQTGNLDREKETERGHPFSMQAQNDNFLFLAGGHFCRFLTHGNVGRVEGNKIAGY